VNLLLLSGSTRAASSNRAVLTTLQSIAPLGSSALRYDGLSSLPAFNPDDDHDPLPEAVTDLRGHIAAADAIVVCTPEYAGTLPGSFKNLLDWTVGGTEISAKPVAWMNIAAAGRGGGATATLELVLGYVGADIVTDACVQLPVGPDALRPDGLVTDGAALEAMAGVWTAIQRRLGEPA
jgi:chromate reductase